MKKTLGSRTTILILGGLSILVIFYMIASLGGLELRPSRPFAYAQEIQPLAPGEPPSWNGIGYLAIFFVLVLVVIFFLLPPEHRKKYLRALALFALVGVIVILVLSKLGLVREIPQPQEPPGASAVTPASEPTGTPEPLVTPSVFSPPQVSPWTSYLVAVLILLGGVGVWVWLVWRKRNDSPPLDGLAEIARSALGDIEAGKDWGDTILNSYYQMNKVVADWRGIRRQAGMTPAEFAKYLVSAHLPAKAVSQLTFLFERVRYGDKKSTPEDIRAAVECLTAILDHCQAEQ
jgi:hypothetical protein